VRICRGFGGKGWVRHLLRRFQQQRNPFSQARIETKIDQLTRPILWLTEKVGSEHKQTESYFGATAQRNVASHSSQKRVVTMMYVGYCRACRGMFLNDKTVMQAQIYRVEVSELMQQVLFQSAELHSRCCNSFRY
jgi:hypothetical protein